ncbi:MAG: cupin domain-containing protein [Gammaproteobacteria bacterium]|nr:cupin domain-containing protein [Gammaproteobacteria bacterium]
MADTPPRWHAAFDAERFLARDWQRRPRLIERAFPDWQGPLAPAELARLTRDADVESRVVWRAGRDWRLAHGPFSAAQLRKLPPHGWTLLVQAVDQHVPAVRALRDAFRFLPDWRVDDVMVSHAVANGGVGPHYDQYDVFLVQGRGRRRWRVGGRCDARTPLRDHPDLRLLARFEARHEWILEPGDVLYLPARFAHDGVALDDDCMTYSVGLRAPSRAELVGHWADHLLQQDSEDLRYTDALLDARADPAELDAATLARVRALMRAALDDDAGFDDWFARLVSEPKYPRAEADEPSESVTAVRARLARGERLARHPASRFLYLRAARGPSLTLYVDGEAHLCRGAAARLALRLCADTAARLDAQALRAPAALTLVTALLAQQALTWEARDG